MAAASEAGVSFTWFEKLTRMVNKMPGEYRLAMVMAIINYGTYGIEPDLPCPLDFAFEGIRDDIDNSVAARTCNRGGRPKKSGKAKDGPVSEPVQAPEKTPVSHDENGGFETAEPPLPKPETQTNTSQSNTNQTKTEKEKERAERFAPPSPEEVAAYAAEKGLKVDAGRFCDFYASKGWMVGRSKMRDWRAAVRNWAARDRPGKEAGPSDEYSRL